jgi:hypothetical protein
MPKVNPKKDLIRAEPVYCSMMTRHASTRMKLRGIRPEVIELVLEYGRAVFTRGAIVYAVGHKEVRRYLKDGIDLSECDGIHIVCSIDGSVLTVYRNRSFRGLRSGRRRGRHRRGKRRTHSISTRLDRFA